MDVGGSDPKIQQDPVRNPNGYSKLSSCSSICSFKDVASGNTRVVHRAENSPESTTVGQDSGVHRRKKHPGSSRSNGQGSYTSSSRGMQLRKFSGCYECHAIVDPASWQNKDHPIFTIQRILKVNNTRRTIQRFEDYRDAVKIRATATASRCAADGNELLRFHCTTLACPLGSHGSSSVPGCGVCTVIRHGFQSSKSGDGGRKGVCTTASSGRAHDSLAVGARGVRAMLVCRVIAGKVKRVEGDALPEDNGTYDSVAGYPGLYSNIEELYVYNPRAILLCFVVIYEAVES
ncbi:hypothetical protein L1987_16041 [Smallanthus sonchifolius]|uniref:Uncharacterized protein n=1 Tax=Smallanthus sonchifolius TaxID=185202 RepID=A0ACB9J9I5_9ASTR|nr:hypothetical protein L1987_16041 [Smallanthus sonchifolius]